MLDSRLNRRIKNSFRKFSSKPPAQPELIFPTCLSPMSTIDSKFESKPYNSPPTPTTLSLSSYGSYSPEREKKGPWIEPYVYTQSNQLQYSKLNKNVGEQKCFICDELIQNKLADESILELQCGWCIHEQCFIIRVNCSLDNLFKSNSFTANKSRLANLLLPVCQCDNCKGQSKCVLTDISYIDNVLHNAILRSIEYDKMEIDNSRNRPLRRETRRISSLRDSIFSQTTTCSIGSSTNSIDDISLVEHRNIAPEVLKDKLLEHLLVSSNLSLNKLVRLGNLRLADELLIKYDDWVLTDCYLFDNYLLISGDPNLIDLRESKFELKQETIVIDDSIAINCKNPNIIEKWCIGLSDSSLVFPSEIISSTLSIDQLSSPQSHDSTIFSQCSPLHINSFGSDPPDQKGDMFDDDEVNDSINQCVDHSINQCVDYSVNKCIEQSIGQTVQLKDSNLDLDLCLDGLGIKIEDSDETDDYDSDQDQINLLLDNKWEAIVNSERM